MTRIDSLIERIDRLETTNRRQRNLTLASFVVVALIACTGATQTSNGATMAPMSSGAAQTSTGVAQTSTGTAQTAGGPLTINGTNGHSITIDGDDIFFKDSSGTTRFTMGFTTDGATALEERDTGGKKRITLSVGTDSNPGLNIWDASGTSRAYVGAYTDGTYGEATYDTSGKATSHQP